MARSHVIWGSVDVDSTSSSNDLPPERPSVGIGTKRRQGSEVDQALNRRDLHRVQRAGCDPESLDFSSETGTDSSASNTGQRNDQAAPSGHAASMNPKAAVFVMPDRSELWLDSADMKMEIGSQDDDGMSMNAHERGEKHRLFEERSIMLQQLLTEDSSLETLEAHGLLDENGAPTSIGSLLHDDGLCKACTASHAGRCRSGLQCLFCHLPHSRTSLMRRKNAMRSCKGKRERVRKLLAKLEQQLEDDPHSFNIENVELPPSFADDPAASERLFARLQQRLSQARNAKPKDTPVTRSTTGSSTKVSL